MGKALLYRLVALAGLALPFACIFTVLAWQTVWADDSGNVARYAAYFRSMIQFALAESLKTDTTKLDEYAIREISLKAAQSELRLRTSAYGTDKDSIRAGLEHALAEVNRNGQSLSRLFLYDGTRQTAASAVADLMSQMAVEPEPPKTKARDGGNGAGGQAGGNRADSLAKHPLSGYRALLGGAWAHSEEGTAKGTFTAALLYRTRFWDSDRTFESVQN